MPLYTNPRRSSFLHGRQYFVDGGWDGEEDVDDGGDYGDDDDELDDYEDDLNSLGYLNLDGRGTMSGFENFYDVSRAIIFFLY
jgi:hypothetical protein